MGGWNEHYKFNQYKVKLNEVFSNLDEIIYISSAIDYKKVNILLYKIVQNFDYYNYYIPPPEEEEVEPQVPSSPEPQLPDKPQVPAEKTKVLYGGRGSTSPPQETAPEAPPQAPPQETPEAPPNETPTEQEPPPPKEQPYSSIDTDEMIDIIMKDQEYQDLIAYIDGVQTNIRRKSGNLIEIINPLTEYLNDKTIENRLILQDFLKQHELIKTKLKTIQENIREINYGIRQKYKIPPRKIKFDVILIPNTIEWEFFKYFINNSSARYHFNRYFYTKQIHVLKGDLSKENMDEFENKLKKLYNDLFIKFNEYIRENKNKPITDKLKGSLSEDAEDPVDDADNPGAMEDYPDTQPIQTLLDMLEEKRGSVSKLFVKPQQPYNPQQQRPPQQPYNPQQQRPPQPYNPQQRPQQRPQPPPYIQQPPQPKEPILDQLTDEIKEKIKNKKDITTQNLIESTKNAKEGVANFLTGLSANGNLGNASSIMDGLKSNIPGAANVKESLADLANGNLGNASSIMDGLKSNIPGAANAKESLANLANGNLGNASSIMDGLKSNIPGAANAKSKFTDLANGNLGNASSIMDGFKNNIPGAANAKGKFSDLAKGKFKGLIPLTSPA
jgi:putative component of toxin-antitoxin plasmid stabilization module